MASAYFTRPSSSKPKNTSATQPKPDQSAEQVLPDKDAQFLQHAAESDGSKPVIPSDENPTKIMDDGRQKEVLPNETVDAPDQVIVPENADNPSAINPSSLSPEARMRQNRGIELPSQEEAEAATGAFNSSIARDAAASDPVELAEKKTWVSFLTSLINNWQTSDASSPASDSQQSSGKTWTELATSYVPSVPNALKFGKSDSSGGGGDEADEATKAKQDRDITQLLEQLKLSTINNRIFALGGDDIQAVYADFTQVLKDIINGVPTAYDDLDKLLRSAGPRLEERFRALPPFIQTLVKSLPMKFAPELMAAAGEKPDDQLRASLANEPHPSGSLYSRISETWSRKRVDRGKKKEKKRRIPTLKSLVSREGVVATMLRNVVTFLQTRFPFLASTTNVVMSLSVFILMFVFWYCHKRGREVRLEREANEASSAATQAEKESTDDSTSDEDADENEVDDETAATAARSQEEPNPASGVAKEHVLEQAMPADIPLPKEPSTG